MAEDTYHRLKPTTSKPILMEEPESISPASNSIQATNSTSPHSVSSKKNRTNISKRLRGHPPPIASSNSSLRSIVRTQSSHSASGGALPADVSGDSLPKDHIRDPDHANRIISQVAAWLQHEKVKQAARKPTKAKGHRLAHAAEATRSLAHSLGRGEDDYHHVRSKRSSSDLSNPSLALEALEDILSSSLQIKDAGSLMPTEDRSRSYFPHRKSSRKLSKLLRKKRSTGAVSDSDAREEDSVPSAEVTLDNSKALRFSGGAATSQVDPFKQSRKATKEEEAWLQFKQEIVRLTHTLRIPGWRRVPIEQGGEIEVARLSGALTNAVYVVTPPETLPAQTPVAVPDGSMSLVPRRKPKKLLLRIYGPQVEHLIDRETELQILRRLARKAIGPTLLGTFSNGRFEEFFHARTLTAEDIRNPDTSKQIAKRMRELHDGIELLKEEREAGPFIWQNWDKWKERCEEVISWLDAQLLANKQGAAKIKADEWKKRGLICGVEWSIFRRAVRDYRDWLTDKYDGQDNISRKLVFAHNDTQYGNLMRMDPSGESPLLLPENSHRQLQVIDFEYASANLPGLEFANHFTEWCYNYHEPSKPYALREKRYPTVEEQRRFLKAYVQHTPPIQGRPSATPRQNSTTGPTRSVSSFMLDSRAPPYQYAEDEGKRETELDAEVERLRQETRIWRVANSAQWVAWGIVQAKVPGMDEALEAQKTKTRTQDAADAGTRHPHAHVGDGSEPPCTSKEEASLDTQDEPREANDGVEGAQEGEGEDEFDYLGYAQERALFFWGDVLQLGIVQRCDLPEDLLAKIKMVAY